jgi:hypothetical protein
MRVKKTTPNCIVYGELGRMPMSILDKARMNGFWEHILNGKKEKISHTNKFFPIINKIIHTTLFYLFSQVKIAFYNLIIP